MRSVGGGHHHPHGGTFTVDRSSLGRLRDDERTNERRRTNVGNLGSTWLKPPGLAKTLFQLREERREAEEHAEAMRREMLAQELAEAEAAGGTGPDMAVDAMLDEEGAGMMGVDGDGDEQMIMGDDDEGGRDLDDDIPDADDGGFGFDGASDDDEDEEEDDDNGEDDEEVDEVEGDGSPGMGGNGDGSGGGGQLRRVQQRELASRMATMRATEDRMREMMARGGHGAGVDEDLYGAEEDVDEEEQAHMLEEDDLVGSTYPEDMDDLGMEANLDDDIPEGESGGYEHTDSEASLSSDEDADHNISYAGMRPPHLPHPRNSMASGAGPRSSLPGGYGQRSSTGGQGQRSSLPGAHPPRNSLDISSILSRDESSMMGSSPRLQRR